MNTETEDLKRAILAMRDAYARGENTMEVARNLSGSGKNQLFATLVAYDLQSGSYVECTRSDPNRNQLWTRQLASLIESRLPPGGSILEVGCGEATTLAGVVKHLPTALGSAYGFDLSWSRCDVGRSWLSENGVAGKLFVADLFSIPLEDNSIDVVYTSHSLEPNGGREEEAIRELFRVAKHAVVLVEPVYELAEPEAQERMIRHGYVRNLLAAAEATDAKVTNYQLLEHIANPLNPSGSLVMEKQSGNDLAVTAWRCPLTHVRLEVMADVFFARETGIAYPVMREIPLLRSSHAIVASKIS